MNLTYTHPLVDKVIYSVVHCVSPCDHVVEFAISGGEFDKGGKTMDVNQFAEWNDAKIKTGWNVSETKAVSLIDAMAKVEETHFRTQDDTGANPCANLVWNTLRRQVGLPWLEKKHLPYWNGKAYVMPPDSQLLANRKSE